MAERDTGPDTPTAVPTPDGYLEPIRAAGALLWRDVPGTGRREVALVRLAATGEWTLPKGKLRNGEHLLSAAVREVTEETGIRPVLGRRLPPRHYLKNGWPKRVEWWAATPAAESVVGPDSAGFTAAGEVDAVEWVPLDSARKRLARPHDVRSLEHFAAGPAATFPLVLLRHASAGDKRGWNGEDLLRPLDESGRVDARELAGVLAAFGAPRVLTSAAARCTETVLPYAAASGAEVRTERAFTAGAPDGPEPVFDVPAARAALVRVLDEGLPTVVCTHGELVGDLVRAAMGRLGAPVPQQPGLRKGSFWVVHVARSGPARALAAAERHAVDG